MANLRGVLNAFATSAPQIANLLIEKENYELRKRQVATQEEQVDLQREAMGLQRSQIDLEFMNYDLAERKQTLAEKESPAQISYMESFSKKANQEIELENKIQGLSLDLKGILSKRTEELYKPQAERNGRLIQHLNEQLKAKAVQLSALGNSSVLSSMTQEYRDKVMFIGTLADIAKTSASLYDEDSQRIIAEMIQKTEDGTSSWEDLISMVSTSELSPEAKMDLLGSMGKLKGASDSLAAPVEQFYKTNPRYTMDEFATKVMDGTLRAPDIEMSAPGWFNFTETLDINDALRNPEVAPFLEVAGYKEGLNTKQYHSIILKAMWYAYTTKWKEAERNILGEYLPIREATGDGVSDLSNKGSSFNSFINVRQGQSGLGGNFGGKNPKTFGVSGSFEQLKGANRLKQFGGYGE